LLFLTTIASNRADARRLLTHSPLAHERGRTKHRTRTMVSTTLALGISQAPLMLWSTGTRARAPTPGAPSDV
jgi:hypothetical protein